MKILMIPSWYPSEQYPKNGSFFQEQANFLAAAGHEVYVVSPRVTFLPFWRGFDFEYSTEGPLRVLRLNLPSLPLGTRIFERFFYGSAMRRAQRFLAKEGFSPAVIHCHSIYPALLLARPWRRETKLPVVLTEHRPSSIDRPTWDTRGRRLRQEVAAASVTTAVSRAFCAALTEHWGREFELLELPVPDEFFALERPEPSNPIALHISHLDPVKQVEKLLAAWALVVPTQPQAKLLIGGGTEAQITPLRQLAESLGVANSVRFLGHLSRLEVAQEMAKAAVFVLPSRVEAGGTVLGEAQSLGTPIVATPTWAGISSRVDGFGEIAADAQPHTLAAAITAVMTGECDHQELRRRSSARFSVQSFVQRSVEYYQKACKHNRAEK